MSDPPEAPQSPVVPEGTPDLQRQSEEFLSSLGMGSRAGEELLEEHQRLVAIVRALSDENTRLRSALQSDSTVHQLLTAVERLERDKQDLLARTAHAEETFSRFREEFMDISTELSNLGNLYVASSQLFGSVSPRGVMRHIKEVLAQLVGAERYAIYLSSNDGRELVPVASEGIGGDQLVNHPLDQGPLWVAFRAAAPVVNAAADSSSGTLDQPAALIPLRVDARTVGVAVVYSTLPQKKSFSPVDHELFSLLGRQAVWALTGACLFAAAGHRLPGLEAFVDLSV
jgi:hypothetical protein